MNRKKLSGRIRAVFVQLWHIAGESGNMKQNMQRWAQYEG
jgi:hypothetical protein